MEKYIIDLGIIIAVSFLYLQLAIKFNIIDKPNERSSHSEITIRGGGVLFPISILLWSLIDGVFNPFIIGLLCISIISFIDDCKPLSNKVRISIHFISIGLLLYQLGFAEYSFIAWALGLLFVGGWINAYNFMDGINGITVLYSLSVLAACYYLNTEIHYIKDSLLLYTVMALVVFGFYNVRKRAKSFAGDVGSVSMAFIIAFIVLNLILFTKNWQYVLLVSVYGIDTLVTIIQRLLNKEQIFKAHRSHLYQYLANELKAPHVFVSLIYAIAQLILNAGLVFLIIPKNNHLLALLYLVLQGLLYIFIKHSVLSRINIRTNA